MKPETIREIITLAFNQDFSNKRIAKLTHSSPNTVSRYRLLIESSNLLLSDMERMTDDALHAQFSNRRHPHSDKRMPDWPTLHRLMQKKHQTLIQLWEEYRRVEPDSAYSYSQFTFHYREYVSKIDISMRQTYLPGEVGFVDFAGKRPRWNDPKTGEQHKVEVFVAVLGCSQKIFAIALKSQKIEDWLHAHVKMVEFYGGVPMVVVPDNLKSAVTKPGRIPVLNRCYSDLAKHYGFVIEPARVRAPKNKALSEIGVLLVTRWITTILNRQQFFSLDEINKALGSLLEELNQRPFKRYSGCRNSRFRELEKDALLPLPVRPYVYGFWTAKQKVPPDYHVYVLNHAYSVPYRLIGQQVESRVCKDKVEIYCQHKRVALHIRSFEKGGASTEASHRPKSHNAFAAQSKGFYITWASSIGEGASAAVSAQFDGAPAHSIKGCRAASKLQALAKQYGNERFESACKCAEDINSLTLSSIRSILQCRIDEARAEATCEQAELPFHHNVRGADYFLDKGI